MWPARQQARELANAVARQKSSFGGDEPPARPNGEAELPPDARAVCACLQLNVTAVREHAAFPAKRRHAAHRALSNPRDVELSR